MTFRAQQFRKDPQADRKMERSSPPVVENCGNAERASTRMLHKSLVRELARPFNVGLFEYIGACVFASHG